MRFRNGADMKITYIRPSKEKGYLTVGISDGEEKLRLSVRERDHRECGAPLTGDNLTRDTLYALKASDEEYRARKKALNILSFGDNSEKMLEYKLSRAGIGRECAKGIVREMVSLGYINNERQLDSLISNLVNVSNLGKMKIIPKLSAKGYSRSDIEARIDELVLRGEIDFELARARLIEKRLPPDADEEEIKKLLYKNGFSVC